MMNLMSEIELPTSLTYCKSVFLSSSMPQNLNSVEMTLMETHLEGERIFQEENGYFDELLELEEESQGCLKSKGNLLGFEKDHDTLQGSVDSTIMCIHWLAQNKRYLEHFPSDIVQDYVREKGIKIKRQPSVKMLLVKIKNFLKYQIKNSKSKNENNAIFLKSKFDTNTNTPCCFSNRMSRESGRSYKNYLDISRNTDDSPRSSYKVKNDDTSDTSSTMGGSQRLLPKRNVPTDSYLKNNFFKSSEECLVEMPQKKSLPRLITNRNRSFRRKMSVDARKVHEGKSLYKFLDILAKKYPPRELIPHNYTLCFTFYVYMYPSQTDGTLLIFQRHELNTLSKLMDPFDVSRLIADTKADFLFDRRIRMIQNQSKCHIILDPLGHIFFNGLPYRLMSIFSSSYDNIARALSIMEETMPAIMRTCLFKEFLPLNFTGKFANKDMVVRPPIKLMRVDNANKTWFNRIDPSLRFSSFNYLIKGPKDKGDFAPEQRLFRKTMLSAESFPSPESPSNEQIWSRNTDTQRNTSSCLNLKTKSKSFDLIYEIVANSFNESEIKSDHHNENMSNAFKKSSKSSVEYNHKKRIKCPASILKKNIFLDQSNLDGLFNEFQCKIIDVDEENEVQEKEVVEEKEDVLEKCSEEEKQVKLTILYKSKTQLYEFCDALGLSLKRK